MVMEDTRNHLSNNKISKHNQALSPVKLQKVRGVYGQVESGGEAEGEGQISEGVWSIARQEEGGPSIPPSSLKELRISHTHSKKVIKHALRQQAKRRRKNTTIAAGNSAPLPRILVPPQCDLDEGSNRTCYRPPTMLEVLSSIPGFSIKPRKRSNKKLSAAAQLEQTKEGCIDLETPDSILVNTNLRSLLNKHTFSQLPPLYQYKLVQLLPHVDRTSPGSDSFRLSASGLNNEFFARACLEWRERLAEGEFTPENQQKLKAEAEREKSKLDPWKLKHFEPIWGESGGDSVGVGGGMSSRVEWTPPSTQGTNNRPALKTTIKLRPPPTPPPPRLRTVGAITRAIASYREKREAEENSLEANKKLKTTNKQETAVEERLPSPTPAAVVITAPPSPPQKNEELLEKEERSNNRIEDMEVKSPESIVPHDWESVEVIRVDPIQEYEESNSQTQSEHSQGTKEDDVCDDNDSKASLDEMYSESVVDHVTVEQVNTQETCTDITSDERIVEQETEQMDESVLTEIKLNSYVQSDVCEDIEDASKTVSELQIEPEECMMKANVICDENNDSKKDSELEVMPQESENSLVPETLVETQICMLSDINNKTEDNVNIQDETVDIRIDVCDIETPNNTVSQEEAVSLTAVQNSICEADSEVQDSRITEPIPVGNSEVVETTEVSEPVKEEWKIEKQEPGEMFVPTSTYNSETAIQETIGPDTIISTDQPMTTDAPSDVSYSVTYSDILYQDTLKEEEEVEVQAALLAAAWDAVDSSTEKLLAQVAMQGEGEVAVIPMQEELEVRLEESCLPPPPSDWPGYEKMENVLTVPEQEMKPMPSAPYPGHVKLELEVTLTPEVDSQVSSTMEGVSITTSGSGNTSTGIEEVPKSTALTVIPPTTIVCLPSSTPPPPLPLVPPPTTSHLTTAQTGVVSSSAVPYLALTTSTPVRALPTKTPVKPSTGSSTSGRSSRNMSNKPPPGAVNLERSYQICQAVIQNSPNRDQLRCQLKPPPSHLIGKSDKTQYSVVTSSRGAKVGTNKTRTYQQRPTPPVLVKHVFTSSQGIPVTMAVLPHSQPPSNPEVAESQMGQYILVQRTGAGPQQVRRSSSAPPSNNEGCGVGAGRGRPASVGLQRPPTEVGVVAPGAQPRTGGGGDSPTPGCYPNKHSMRSQDCACSLKAMIVCKKCGAFCHDDCIGPSRLCVTCLIR